jgi:hypothetical protein
MITTDAEFYLETVVEKQQPRHHFSRNFHVYLLYCTLRRPAFEFWLLILPVSKFFYKILLWPNCDKWVATSTLPSNKIRQLLISTSSSGLRSESANSEKLFLKLATNVVTQSPVFRIQKHRIRIRLTKSHWFWWNTDPKQGFLMNFPVETNFIKTPHNFLNP